MKIITLKYNRQHSAIQQSTLLSDTAFAGRHLFLLEQKKTNEPQSCEKVQIPKDQEYIICGYWH
ncbi:MAG: hypothetical protein L3J49_08540 [Desulfobulbaceae bacterium]|nr:hypothetical protein [Desulfobulbaceae bacterium]